MRLASAGVLLFPAIDLRGGRCVRLAEGDFSRQTVYDDDPVAVAERFQAAGAPWIHVVDLDAVLGQGSNRDLVIAVARGLSLPEELRHAGAHTVVADLQELLRAVT